MSDEHQTSRKRQKKPEQWKSNSTKKKRNSGEAYISRKTNQEVPARTIGPPCTSKCQKHCFDKLGAEKIETIFKSFWENGNYDLQNVYLSKCLEWDDPAHSDITNRPSRKLRTIRYSVYDNGEKVNVCRQAFLSIHGLGEKRVRTVLAKETPSGIVKVDKRGKKPPGNKMKGDRRQLVKDHIESLATVSSHYSRAKSPFRKYMPPGSSISGCYEAYQEWLHKYHSGETPVLESYYHHVFVNDYNIGVEPPTVDECNTCAKHKLEIAQLKKSEPTSPRIRILEADQNAHLLRQKVAQQMMEGYKGNTDESIEVICVDLQQALPTPKLTCNSQYYKRKMWTYNLGIHNIKNGKATMYVWDETIAKRGSCEIASFLTHYLENFVSDQVNTVIIFSDNCGGQNKNLNIVLSHLRFIHSSRFETIKHIFLIPGHSEMGCDRDFGQIKLKTKDVEVFSKKHYIHFIEKTRRKNKFHVVEVKQEMVKDIDVLQTMVTKNKLTGAKFKEGKIFEFSKEYKVGFKIQQFYNTNLPKEVQLQKGKNRTYNQTLFNLASTELPQKYTAPLKLTEEKQKDLQDLLPFVPLPYKSELEEALRGEQENLEIPEVNDDDDNIDYD